MKNLILLILVLGTFTCHGQINNRIKVNTNKEETIRNKSLNPTKKTTFHQSNNNANALKTNLNNNPRLKVSSSTNNKNQLMLDTPDHSKKESTKGEKSDHKTKRHKKSNYNDG